MYTKWTKHTGISPTIEMLPDCARHLWIYEKRVDKVLLYLFGVSYLFCHSPSFMKFFWQLQFEHPILTSVLKH
ncbi:hypothetical protein ARMGADRAFT_1089870 [Armillaria gallica]|uniref:Uncharacterized protein n=1 Tax=Armillaria gallica TaxID=47427 RepID=A0A2H3CM61_ARMGA|nr:hypothetical protein ARMGADRAFT_1089870 [Armillaria gallica]